MIRSPETNSAGSSPTVSTPRKPKRVGDLLLEMGLVDQSQLEHAIEYQRGAGGKKLLGEALIELGYVTAEQVLEALAGSAGLPFARLNHRRVDPKIAEVLPKTFCERHQVAPLFKVRDRLTVATAEVENPFLAQEVEEAAGCPVQLMIAPPGDVASVLASSVVGEDVFAVDEVLAGIDASDIALVEGNSIDLADAASGDDSPIIKLINYLIYEAVREKASDIHIEPDDRQLRVRFRVDGRLYEKMQPPSHLAAAMASRVKIMAGLDIAERRVPQDGVISIRLEKRQVDLRVSTLPGKFGEKVVMRVADTRNAVTSLDALGFHPETLRVYRDLVSKPNGVVLVTGPTGSGKSTTLYGTLTEINRDDVNLSTVEDPVELNLPGVNQFQTNDKAGFHFANALRALLRQDPDVVMVGEIRDAETGTIAVQAALTGHLVLSTLHTNDAVSAVTRLHNIGVENYLLAAAMQGVLAQRLVRKLCPSCAQRVPLGEAVAPAVEKLVQKHNPELTHACVPGGCEDCRQTGYKGRLGLYELYAPGDGCLDAIVAGAGLQELRRLAPQSAKYYDTLLDDGLRKVEMGLTSIDEVLAVTGG